LAIAAGHVLAQRALEPSMRALPVYVLVAATVWGMLAYVVVVLLAHQGQLKAWLRERELAAERLRAGIEEARLSSATQRARPEELLEHLERLATTVGRDPSGAEHEL